MIDHYRKKIEEKQSELSELTNLLESFIPASKYILSSSDMELYRTFDKDISENFYPNQLGLPKDKNANTSNNFDHRSFQSPYRKIEKFIYTILIIIGIGFNIFYLYGFFTESILESSILGSIISFLFMEAVLIVTIWLVIVLVIFLIINLFLKNVYLILNRKSIKKYYLLKEHLEENIKLEKKDSEDIKVIQQNIEKSSKDLLYYQECLKKAQEVEAMKIAKQEKLEAEKKIQELENRQFQMKADFWLKLNGYDFENEIAKLFKRKGYKVQQTSFSGDGGADIIVTDTSGEKFIIQCKNHKNPVSPHIARDLLGTLIDYKVDSGILINTGGFTHGTIKFSLKHPLTLYDIRDIVRIANS